MRDVSFSELEKVLGAQRASGFGVHAEVEVREPAGDGLGVGTREAVRHSVWHLGPGLWRVDLDGRLRLIITHRQALAAPGDGARLVHYESAGAAWRAVGLTPGGVLGWNTGFLEGLLGEAGPRVLGIRAGSDPDLGRDVLVIETVEDGAKDFAHEVTVDVDTGLVLGFAQLGGPGSVRTLAFEVLDPRAMDGVFALPPVEVVDQGEVTRLDAVRGRRRAAFSSGFDAESYTDQGIEVQVVRGAGARSVSESVIESFVSALRSGSHAPAEATDRAGRPNPLLEAYRQFFLDREHPVALVWEGFRADVDERPEESIAALLALEEIVRTFVPRCDARLLLTD